MGYKPIDCGLGFHQLKGSVNQLGFMEKHCQTILDCFEDLHTNTKVNTPNRSRDFVLDRQEKQDPDESERERRLEKSIWQTWGPESEQGFLKDVCQFIQTFQVPLFAKQTKRGWGYIDLLGVSVKSLPIVIELKAEKANDTPLGMLVEALAYAIAVKSAWDVGRFRSEWQRVIRKHEPNFDAPATLASVPLILIAPEKFWTSRTGKPGKGVHHNVKPDVWRMFAKVMEKCSCFGYPVTLLTFHAYEELPQVANVGLVTLPV